MKEWINKFWDEHGTRIIFGGMALIIALFMYYIMDLKPQAEVIIIGLGMLCFNKARGSNGEKPDAPTA